MFLSQLPYISLLYEGENFYSTFIIKYLNICSTFDKVRGVELRYPILNHISGTE